MRSTEFSLRLLFAMCLLIARTALGAEMYSCRDATGKLLHQSSTDGCVSEICKTKAGVPVCEETAAERSKREESEKLEAECKEERRRGMLKDFSFLDKYAKRADIDVKREKELVSNFQDIRAAKERRDVVRRRLAQLKEDSEFHGPSHPMPEALAADLDFYTRHLEVLEAEVANAEKRTEEINRENDNLLKRYDKLLKGEFEPVPCDKK